MKSHGRRAWIVLRIAMRVMGVASGAGLSGGMGAVSGAATEATVVRPGHAEWPVVWTTYRPIEGPAEDYPALEAAGVGLVSCRADTAEEVREALAIARQTGMKYHIDFPEITENERLVREAGADPVPILMIGGVYKGRAIDRNVYSFSAGPQEIVIEPPVYNQKYAYTRGSGGTGEQKKTEKIAHYFPDMPAPVRAEVVVPLAAYDGKQHLKIIEAQLSAAPADARPENDSAAGLEETTEIRTRKLYRLTFDLSGMEGAILDKVGVAVYWPYHGTDQYWMFQHGNVSAHAESTRAAARHYVRKTLHLWIDANGGSFPSDVVLASRFGDECFYISSHLNGPSVSCPLWGYGTTGIAAFRRRVGKDVEYPRTWGYPEVYGAAAYAWWMYTLHKGAAELCEEVREEAHRLAPGLLVFRNQTRMGVFGSHNDFDGSGQELLTRSLDFVHLDPYPVGAHGYGQNIPRDMHYLAGLARRYDRMLIPWMQAHTYGGPDGLQHVSPADVDRMADEQMQFGVDAVMWLGWGPGMTFPLTRPDSWERAIAFHRRLQAAPPPNRKAELAVVRPYTEWALASRGEGSVRNPADWLLQQFLEVWAVRHGRYYDVFETPPAQSEEEIADLAATLKKYRYVVSTQAVADAWVIGEGTRGQTIETDKAAEIQNAYERRMVQRGWLPSRQ